MGIFFKKISKANIFYFSFGVLITPILFLTLPDSLCQRKCRELIKSTRENFKPTRTKPQLDGNVVDDINSFAWYRPESDHKINSLKDLKSYRRDLRNLVIDRTSYVVNKNKYWIDKEYNNFKNLSHIDKINFIHKKGVDSYAYLFVPNKSNNKLIVFHQGHDGNFSKSKIVLNYFNSKGYYVIAYQMPLLGTNPGILNARNEIQRAHSVLVKFETSKKSFISLFVTPVVLGIDNLTKDKAFDSIAMVGSSGGGWTTVLAAAADKRINYSFPISGSLPLSLRSYDMGDLEQYHHPFYSKYSYLDLYLMGSSGLSRGQVQMTNLYDPCCFSGFRSKLYAEYLTKVSKKLNGDFSTNYIDGYEHKIYKSQYEFIHKKINNWDNL